MNAKNNKTDSGNFFEDFKLRQIFHCPTPRTITSGDISSYISLTGDRTPRFCDERLEIHPLFVFHSVLGQTVRQISLNARANLGYAGLRWLEPVFANDSLQTRAEVVGLKENSNRETGIVYVKTTAENQKGKAVLEYTRWVMVKKRSSDCVTAYLDAPSVPDLPEALDIKDLQAVSAALPQEKLTGGAFYFEDYAVGERIVHVDGVTVNPSDHMTFTRLFQNTAKIHFDVLLTDGKPLVYGGVPISVGYAQSFNGLQNRTGICAINAGSHANPVYAGDTLYSFTEVLDKKEFGAKARVGALRLRLIVLKNEPPKTHEGFAVKIDHPQKPGQKFYHSNVVLDLDYWDQMTLAS